MTADLNVFQNVEKSVCAKAFGTNNRIKTPANHLRPRSTRLCEAPARRARTDANEFSSDKALLVLIGVIRRHARITATDRAGDDYNEHRQRSHCSWSREGQTSILPGRKSTLSNLPVTRFQTPRNSAVQCGPGRFGLSWAKISRSSL